MELNRNQLKIINNNNAQKILLKYFILHGNMINQ